MKKDRVKVLIADDSMLMRLLIKDLLSESEELEVVGVAGNGLKAASMCEELHPDVVLMDMNMGEYDGLFGIKRIMEHCPTPIIILSAVGNQDMDSIMEGLHSGAIDYLNKPAKNHVNMQEISASLIEKIKTAAKAAPTAAIQKKQNANLHAHSFDGVLPFELIVIAASTGGPSAIEQIITHLPQNLPVPVVLIQHIPQHFISSFAERLDKISPLRLVVPQKGDVVEKSNIYLVPTDSNTLLRLESDKVVFDFTQERYKAYNFPSADSVFLSAAEVYGKKTLGVILTGMGRDGAMGIKAIKDAGGYTIAQSADTCAVYGMPRAAVEDGAVSKIVKLNDIAGFLVSCLS